MNTNISRLLMHKKISTVILPSFHWLPALLVVMIGFGINAYGFQATGNGIDYQGGPVMHGQHNVYIIWYGDWSNNSALTLLPQFIQNLNNSPYFSTVTTYQDSSLPLQNTNSSVFVMSQKFDSYPYGVNLDNSGVSNIVTDAITGGALPADPNGIYLVLTSKDVTEPSFCSHECGYHSRITISGTDIKYAFVGDPSMQCYSKCGAVGSTLTPNGNPGADAMISIIAHELSETVTDPHGDAWISIGELGGGEVADKCMNVNGPFFFAPNGALADLSLGGVNYLVSEIWINDGGGGCVMAPKGNPFFYASRQDEYYGCHGIARHSTTDCGNINDTNDRQICQAVAGHSQFPCTSMSDRNLQLSCYGIALAPQFPTNCDNITNPQMRAFCYGVSSGGSNAYMPNCSALVDADTRSLCNAMALNDSSYCPSISDANDRQFCLGVTTHSTLACAPISTCSNTNDLESCLNTGGSWDWTGCTCSPPTCQPGQIMCAQSPLSPTVQLKSKRVLEGLSLPKINKKQ